MLSTGRKPLPVCEACRLRKVKCDSVGVACKECVKSHMECRRTPAIRFKHQYLNSGSQNDLEFPPGQAWTLPTASLRYHDETPEIVDMYQKDSGSGGSFTAAFAHSPAVHVEAPSSSKEPERLFRFEQAGNSNALPHAGSLAAAQRSSVLSMEGSAVQSTHTPGVASNTTWEQHAGDARPSPLADSDPMVSRDEAVLLRNFADNMALWADATDLGRSFEIEATKRALTNPVLLYAICAFSSRHVNRDRPEKNDVALEYQNSCLQLLIPAISDPQTVDETTLAAVAILRQNEEMDGQLPFLA